MKQHGADAAIQAAREADLMLERGDRDGQIVWVQIRRAILDRQAPPAGAGH